MEGIEIAAATVELAIEKAEAQLGMSREQFEIEIVREGISDTVDTNCEEVLIRVNPIDLPEEGAIKAVTDILNTLLELLGVTGKVEIISDNIPLDLDIKGDDLGILIGRRGQTLASLEYITKLMVVGKLKTWIPLTIDVDGYRKRRRDSLQRLALFLAEQVMSRHQAITMEPMPADERRIVHMTLADNPDVTTQSMGEGENRKVVILLKQS